MTSAKRRERLLNIGLALGMFLAMCVAAELGLRYVLLSKYNPFEPDTELGVRLKSDFDGTYPRVRVRTDHYGRRIPGDQQGDANGRYLFIGDSVTFGFSMPAKDSFPALVSERLGNRADSTVAACACRHVATVASRWTMRAPRDLSFSLISSSFAHMTLDGPVMLCFSRKGKSRFSFRA